MANEHKHHRSRIEIGTALPPDRMIELGRQVLEAQRGMDLFEDGGSRGFLGGVKSVVGVRLLEFTLEATEVGGRTHASTKLQRYVTSQDTIVFLPIGPKSIQGYSAYRRYLNALQQVIQAADPEATCRIIERDGVAA